MTSGEVLTHGRAGGWGRGSLAGTARVGTLASGRGPAAPAAVGPPRQRPWARRASGQRRTRGQVRYEARASTSVATSITRRAAARPWSMQSGTPTPRRAAPVTAMSGWSRRESATAATRRPWPTV